MPQLLVDLEPLDLSQVVFTREDMQKVLSQRGRFSLMDGVVHFDEAEDYIIAYADLTADDWWAEDHIPGRPIFPGVLMCEAAAQLGTFDFFARRPDFDPQFVGFTGMDKVRFRSVVEPPCRMYIVARVKRVRGMMFTYWAQGLVDDKVVFDGELTGMAL